MTPDATPQQTSAHASALVQQWLSAQSFISPQSRDRIARQYIVITPAPGGIPLTSGQYSRSLSLLLLTSAVLLLIAAANLANMLLARADRGQAAIRSALGASGWRLIRQSLADGIVLALIGGAVGIVIAKAGADALVAIAFPGVQFMPVETSPSPLRAGVREWTCRDHGVLFAGAPAWLMSRVAPLDALSATGRGTQARSFIPRRSLVVAQVALSFAMVTAALLLASSLRNLERQRLGFDPADRWIVRIDPAASLASNPDQLITYFDRLQERLRRVPGAMNVSYAMYSPMEGNNWSGGISIAGRVSDPARPDGASWNRVGPNYFETVGTRLLRGRLLDERDTANARRVAVVNDTFIRRYFNDSEPIGRTLGLGDASHSGDYEIVGVVDDVKYTGANEPVRPMIFLPAFQTVNYTDASAVNTQARSMLMRAVVVHLAPGATNIEASLRQAVGDVDPNSEYPAGDADVDADQRQLPHRAIDGARHRDVRTAGARAGVTRALWGHVVQRGAADARDRRAHGAGCGARDDHARSRTGPMVDALIGLALGVPLAYMAGTALSAQLYDVGGHSPLMIGMAIAILATTALVAAAIPARRATSIDPARALRGE